MQSLNWQAREVDRAGRVPEGILAEIVGKFSALLARQRDRAPMTLGEARAVALSLPGSTEEPHFERTSFRVRGKIFATAPPEGGPLHVFVDEHAVGVAVGMDPQAFEELHWGKKLAGVAVHLARADPNIVRDLLEESWRRRATKGLIRELDERRENP